MTTLVEQRMGLLTDAKPPPIGHYECPPDMQPIAFVPV